LLAAVCFALLAASASAAPGGEEALLRHIRILADDAMEGRKPGTAGGERAVAYIVEQMRQIGLTPGAGDEGWLQPVKLVERIPLSTAMSWRIGNTTAEIDSRNIILLGSERETRIARAPLLFGGYGVGGALDGVDVAGAVVIVLAGNSPGARNAPDLESRRADLARRGAVGMIVPMAASLPWSEVVKQYGAGRTSWADQPTTPLFGALSHAGWTGLAAAAGSDPAGMTGEAAKQGFRAGRLGEVALRVATEVRAFETPNVIGQINGTVAPGEAIAYLSHWDHLGYCRPPGAKDRICNGAVDNASGVASLLETARALADAKPKRTILFVATTAEESGLYGARNFAAHPPRAIRSIKAAINIDMVALAPRGAAVGIIGRGMTPLDPFVDEAARTLGRKIDRGTAQNILVNRQDGWALMQAGIPAIMTGGGYTDMARLNRFLGGDYHGPDDEVSARLDVGGAAEDVALLAAIGRTLADPARFPGSSR
jgi:hypothetical protein